MIDPRKEAHAEDEEDVGEHASEEGCLDQAKFVFMLAGDGRHELTLSEGSNGHDELNSVAKAEVKITPRSDSRCIQ